MSSAPIKTSYFTGFDRVFKYDSEFYDNLRRHIESQGGLIVTYGSTVEESKKNKVVIRVNLVDDGEEDGKLYASMEALAVCHSSWNIGLTTTIIKDLEELCEDNVFEDNIKESIKALRKRLDVSFDTQRFHWYYRMLTYEHRMNVPRPKLFTAFTPIKDLSSISLFSLSLICMSP
jgi:hypothetical protein